jgi:hypothetical protein
LYGIYLPRLSSKRRRGQGSGWRWRWLITSQFGSLSVHVPTRRQSLGVSEKLQAPEVVTYARKRSGCLPSPPQGKLYLQRDNMPNWTNPVLIAVLIIAVRRLVNHVKQCFNIAFCHPPIPRRSYNGYVQCDAV